jgi:hypothetical protein
MEESSAKGCNIATPGGSFVSNIVSANLNNSCSSFSHLLEVSMPRSLEQDKQQNMNKIYIAVQEFTMVET